MTNNLKKINEYKRILRKLLDDEGLRGVTLKGNSYGVGDSINVRAWAAVNILVNFKGQEVILVNDSTGKMAKFNLADPASIDGLKKIFNDDIQRILNGPKNA
jgi:hypothetical protein